MKVITRYDLAHLVAEPGWQALQQQLEQEHNDLVIALAYNDLPEKERHEKRGRLLLIKEILTWVERTEEKLPKEAKKGV